MKSFPTLYKKTSTGKIQTWKVVVAENRGHGVINTTFGQLDGKMQEGSETIKEGKNIGKKNETSPFEQACAEAQSQWEGKKKKGYVESIGDARDGTVDEIIEGGVDPMLAHKFRDHGHKIAYPAFVQPKLDGHRCIAIIKNGVCTLWSRTRKPICSMPHIQEELANAFKGKSAIIDGELYNHRFKTNFEHISSLVRQERPAAGCTDVEYHAYDIITEGGFQERFSKLTNALTQAHLEYVKVVQTVSCDAEDKLMELFDLFVSKGYEGAMIRNAKGEYVGKRSYDLLKVKEFDDAEFKIVNVVEGRGKLAGHGMFVCVTDTGAEFEVKMKGELEELKKYWQNPRKYIGKTITVQFQGYTGKNKVPRFGVGLRFRESE